MKKLLSITTLATALFVFLLDDAFSRSALSENYLIGSVDITALADDAETDEST